MPNPVKLPVGSTTKSGPKIVLERPDLAKLIGAIAAEWGSIDALLESIFNSASLAKRTPHGQIDSELATLIFEELTTYRAKTSLIGRILTMRYDSDLLDEFRLIEKSLNKKASERAKIIHASWYICEKYPNDLLSLRSFNDWFLYTEKDFLEALDRAVEVERRLVDFSLMVASAERKDIDQ